jgi:hypothetical protein
MEIEGEINELEDIGNSFGASKVIPWELRSR